MSVDNEFGYNANAIDNYLEQIHSDAFLKAKQALDDLSGITSAAEASWEGEARQKWLDNLAADKDHVVDQLNALYRNLQNEVISLGEAMHQKDQTMIQ